MFRIDTSTQKIELTRGDKATIGVKIPLEDGIFYTFKTGDIVSFGVYKARGFNSSPLILKEVIVEEETEEVLINLASEETKIGSISSRPTAYWYEVQLNNKQTILGYDDEGAKILTLYPEGRDKE